MAPRGAGVGRAAGSVAGSAALDWVVHFTMAMLGGDEHLVAPGADESTQQAAEALVGRVARRDWAALSLPEQIQHMELEGYCVFPGTLSPGHIAEIKALAADWPTDGRDVSAPALLTLPPA